MKERRVLRHVFRSSKYNDMINVLAKESGGGVRVFQTIKQLMCFAAFLGFHLERKISFETDEHRDEIQEHIFSNDEEARQAIYLIALAEYPDITILHPDKTSEMVGIFEEYANGGLAEIKTWFDRYPTEKPQNIILSGLKELGLISAAPAPTKSGGKIEI